MGIKEQKALYKDLYGELQVRVLCRPWFARALQQCSPATCSVDLLVQRLGAAEQGKL